MLEGPSKTGIRVKIVAKSEHKKNVTVASIAPRAAELSVYTTTAKQSFAWLADWINVRSFWRCCRVEFSF